MNNSGRIARLYNLDANSELNGAYVVTVLESSQATWNVQTLPIPNEPQEPTTMNIPGANYDFVTNNSFCTVYPDAPVLPLHSYDEIEDGSIVEIDNSTFLPERLTITHNALVRGQSVPYTPAQDMNPATLAACDILVMNEARVAVIDFEDLHLTQPVMCVMGNNITFRRCRFSNSAVGVNLSASKGGVRVVFESCLFENSKTAAVLVRENSRAELYNCRIRNVCSAVIIDKGGSVDMVHCTVEAADCCMYAVASSVTVSMVNCTITNCQYGSVLLSGSDNTLTMQGCLVRHCQDKAVILEGPKRVTIHIENCVFTHSLVGLHVSLGQMDCNIVNTTVSHCTNYGIYLSQSLTGRVVLTNCTCNGVCAEPLADCANVTDSRCEVVINGVRQNKGNQDERLDALRPYRMATIARNPRRDEMFELPLHRGRLYKKATQSESYVRCARCDKCEPLQVKFKVCSRCHSVCYCSRECQVAHWKVHKKQCVHV